MSHIPETSAPVEYNTRDALVRLFCLLTERQRIWNFDLLIWKFPFQVYAVGIGCSDLKHVYELDPNFEVFPTFPVVLTFKAGDAPGGSLSLLLGMNHANLIDTWK